MSIARRGCVISAPSSGAGKTTVTLGLLRALRDRGEDVGSAKSGPDYIDPAFHAAATGRPCVTLDPWCMDTMQLGARSEQAEGRLLIVEGAMGLFDAAPSHEDPMGRGSTADTAAALGLPVIIVIDAARRSQTAAAIVQGLMQFRSDIRIGGVILNRIGSARHEAMLRRAVETVAPVLGAIPRDAFLAVPSRHLGLKQAGEIEELDTLIASLGTLVSQHCDLDALVEAAAPLPEGQALRRLKPLGQRIAVAQDEAFGFAYPHVLADWRAGGAELTFFSPLADETPAADASAVFLPGGYPELYGGKLSAATAFRDGMLRARQRNAQIYGECGGFMVLGQGMIDAYGRRHAMLGMLGVETSFAERRLTLGYRSLDPVAGVPWDTPLLGHEFHYSVQIEATGAPLFHARDAQGDDLGAIGLIDGRVMGSYAHVVDQARG